MFRLLPVPLFISVGLALGTAQAQADEIAYHIGLQCQGSQAAIRFGTDDDGGPIEWNRLPPEREKQWAATPIKLEGKCTLRDGTKLVVRSAEEQAFAYGMGGADPPGFFSLWIDGKKIVSREDFKPGYASDEPYYNTVFYAPGSLQRCLYPTSEDERYSGPDLSNVKALKCETTPVDMAKFEQDPLEMNGKWRAAIGTISVSGSGDPAFCRRFIFPSEKYKDVSAETYINVGPNWTPSKEVLAYLPLHPDLPLEKDRASMTAYSPEGFDFDAAAFDFNNDGKTDTVVRLSAETHYFDGDIFLVKDNAVQPKAAAALAQEKSYEKWARQNAWAIVPSAEDRYMHRALFRLDGTTFVLEHPTNVENEPSATLFRPGASGLEPVCVFQMIEENF